MNLNYNPNEYTSPHIEPIDLILSSSILDLSNGSGSTETGGDIGGTGGDFKDDDV